jgi:hemolysin activation/secretion protein
MFAGICRVLAAWVMVSATSAAVLAQVIPPSELPGRERERFTTYPAAPTLPGAPLIGLPSAAPTPGTSDVKIIIRSVNVTGSTVYRPEELARLYGEFIGHTVPLSVVFEIAKRITDKYGVDGFVLSRAAVVSQTIDPAGTVLQIQVTEGYVDKVEWPAEVGSYRDFFSEYAAKIMAERPSNLRTIERYLLLAGDLPGLRFKNRLVPSTSHPGAATLIVEMTEKKIDALARSDNLGSTGRGPYQYLASASIKNLMHAHEAFTVTAAGSWQFKELTYVAANYRQVLNSEGLSAYVFAGYGWGKPGTVELESIDYRTKSLVVEAGLTYPILRQREHNVTLTGLWFQSDDDGTLLTAPFSQDRLRGFRLRAEADWIDPLGGANQFYGVISQGIQGLGSTVNGNTLASRASGRVDFTKFEGTLARVQPLPAGFSIFNAVLGQYAGTPLLYPEVCGYGGRVFGRAYDPSQLIGDNCFEILGEFRFDFHYLPQGMTQAQLYLYADTAWLHNIAQDPGIASNVNAASAGGGLRLGWLNTVTADLFAVKAIEGPRDDWRFRFVVTARY